MAQSWDVTWMHVAMDVGRRSRCALATVGAVIVTSDNRIVATGYNGPPAGFPPHEGTQTCEAYCVRSSGPLHPGSYGDCVTVHAEANALLFCDRRDREGGMLYVTHAPCWDCCKLIANSGLWHVVYVPDKDRSPDGIELMKNCGLVVRQWT